MTRTAIRRASSRKGAAEDQEREPAGSAAPYGALALLLALPLFINGQVQQGPVETGHWWEMAPPIIILPPQRPHNGRFREVRFSPDGRYVLAQDDSGIAVLSVKPFAVVFQRFAENVSTAGFTPDSQQVWFVSRPEHVVSPQIVFAGSDSYVERWNIVEQTRTDTKVVPLRQCENSGLSPDSRFLACVDTGGTLRIIDVDSGTTVFEKKKFGRAVIIKDDTMATVAVFDDLGSARITFSPDSRFVVAAPIMVDGSTVAWDLHARRQVNLTGGLKKLTKGYNFAFVAPDEIAISRALFGPTIVNATVADFPEGKVLLKLRLPPGPLFRAADPAFVLIRPFGRFTRDSDRIQRIAAVEYRTGQLIISDAQALDVLGALYVSELKDGRLGLYARGKGVQATVAIEEH